MPEERNDARQLSPVLENYLEIIFHQEIREGAARASSIAEAAGVSRSTVTSTLKALKSMGYVCGGAQAVIETLIESVGENGTIMMPTQSWKNLDPETGVHGEVDEKDWPLIRENWPAYDKKMTPTNTMGAVAEMFRQ